MPYSFHTKPSPVIIVIIIIIMPGGVAVPYYAFPGVSIFGLLPGRVYSEVIRFQIIHHCPQPGATGTTSLALPSEGVFVHCGLHYQL